MKRGEWGLGWDGIAFDVDGRLLNGQHRLAAVALSGVAQPFVIARGWPKNSAECNDHGKKRTLSEILQMRERAGLPQPRRRDQVHLVLHAPRDVPGAEGRADGLRAARPLGPARAGATATGGCSTRSDARGLLSDKGKRSPMPITPGTALLYLLSHVEPTDADTFFVRLADGTELAEGDPILVLRNQLMRARLKGNRVGQHVKAAWTILAWNAWQEGVLVEQAQVDRPAAVPEDRGPRRGRRSIPCSPRRPSPRARRRSTSTPSSSRPTTPSPGWPGPTSGAGPPGAQTR
jgi:hypothetical protein